MFDSIFIWAQVVGSFGILLNIAIWQVKSPRKILLLNNLNYSIWAFHFYLLSAPIAVAMNIMSLIKNIFVTEVKETKLKYVIGIYLLISIGISIHLWEGLYSICPILACVCFNISLLFRNNRGIIARGLLVGELCWLPYSIHVGSLMSAIYAPIIISAVLYSMYRHEEWSIGKSPVNLMKCLFCLPKTPSYEAAHA